ncbi:unnamed protein product [Musa textilis]
MADRGCNNGCGCAVPCPGGDACRGSHSSSAGFISSVMSPELSLSNSSDKLDSERREAKHIMSSCIRN